jgi:hypothetical protein
MHLLSFVGQMMLHLWGPPELGPGDEDDDALEVKSKYHESILASLL